MDKSDSDSLFLRLSQTEAISIEESWFGLGTPHSASYNLRGGGDWFLGEARLAVGVSGSGQYRSAIEDIVIPRARVQTFLRRLAGSPLKEGDYQPSITHTDDFPEVAIELESENGTVEFYTQSQGAGHIPWAVTFGGATYIVDSGDPARALKALGPHLKQDTLNQLLEEARWPG